MSDLERQFWRAIRFGRDAQAKLALSFPFSRAVQWGVARVEWWGNDRKFYEPRDDGAALAVIAPVVEAGELIDLAAIEVASEHVGLRLGFGQGLGLDAVERARTGEPLLLVATPFAWLRQPVGAVYLFHLPDVEVALSGVPRFACQTVELAERVHSLVRPSRRPDVLAPKP